MKLKSRLRLILGRVVCTVLLAVLMVGLALPSATLSAMAKDNVSQQGVTTQTGNTQRKILAIGDSISTGYKLSNPKMECFVNIVGAEKKLDVTNKAVNGATSESTKKLIEGGILDEKIVSADIVSVTMGGNDIMAALYQGVANEMSISVSQARNALYRSSDKNHLMALYNAAYVVIPNMANGNGLNAMVENFAGNLQYITKYVKDKNPKAKIIVTTQYNPYLWLTSLDRNDLIANMDKGIERMNNAIRNNKQVLGYDVADVYEDFGTYFKNDNGAVKTKLTNATDKNLDIHPNKEGHKRIAKTVGDIIDTIMEKDGWENSGDTDTTTVTFDDISNHWAKKYIEDVAGKKLLMGTGNGQFSPDMPMTRGMFVTVLGRFTELDAANGNISSTDSGIDMVKTFKESRFGDVASDAYYNGYVEWAAEKEIVSGTGDGNFSPDKAITREEMAVVMDNYIKKIGSSIESNNSSGVTETFTDLKDISSWAISSVAEMKTKGIMTGKSENRFDPKGLVTRGETAAILVRL